MYTVLRDGQELDMPVELARFPVMSVLRESWGGLLFGIMSCGIFLFLLFKRPQERCIQVLVVASSGLLASLGWVFGVQISDIVHGAGLWIYRFTTEGAYLLMWLGFLHFTLIFPEPHPLIVHRQQWLIAIYPIGYGIQLTYLIITGFTIENPLIYMAHRTNAMNIVILTCLLIGCVAMISNYFAQKDAVSKQQIRIVVITSTIISGLAIALWALPAVMVDGYIFSSNTMGIIGLFTPLAIAIAIQKYRLWEIDTLINRTLVYFALTIMIAGIYILIVGTLGALLQTSTNLFVSLFATGLVAVIFQPLRDRVQRFVNRLMYGERDEPYVVLERLSQRLDLVLQARYVLPTIVETVAQALKLPFVAITLLKDGDFEISAMFPLNSEEDIALYENTEVRTLVYQSEVVGQLIFAPRGRGEPFSPMDKQLLETIARQTSIAVYNVRLTDELQRSREELVVAREEERRRLRRDLHDGLGPMLATISVGMDSIPHLVDKPDLLHEVSQDLKSQALSALGDIRRIAYNLRPPALDELGLRAALKQHMDATSHYSGLQLLFDAPEHLPTLPAAVEVAAYRIVLEAVNNVHRHAQATRCHVRVTCGSYLYLEIIDDGCGMPTSFVSGIGLNSMRERASELGGHFAIKPLTEDGGTIILAQLPLPENLQEEVG